jgi:hypothetical protein
MLLLYPQHELQSKRPQEGTKVSTSTGSEFTLSQPGQGSNPTQRRRQQNRDAQRSYRERQERQKKVLEEQVEVAIQKYQELLQTYDLQSEEVSSLRSQVESLQFELDSLSAWRDTSVKFESIEHDEESPGAPPVRLIDEDVLIAEDGFGLGQWQPW